MMKNLLFIAVLMAYSTLIAQDIKKEKFNIAQNQWVLGGNFNFSHFGSDDYTSSSESKGTSWHIAPNIGYTIQDNLLLGLSTSYSFGNSNQITDSDIVYDRDFHALSIRPYVRKFMPLGKRLAFHVDGGISFSKRWEKDQRDDTLMLNSTESESSSFSIGLDAGLTYSLSKSVYFYTSIANLGYYRNKREREDETSKSDLFSFNLFTKNLNFGVMFVL
jgi:hypothetical protein